MALLNKNVLLRVLVWLGLLAIGSTTPISVPRNTTGNHVKRYSDYLAFPTNIRLCKWKPSDPHMCTFALVDIMTTDHNGNLVHDGPITYAFDYNCVVVGYNAQAPTDLLASDHGWDFFSGLPYSIVAHVGNGYLLNDNSDLTADVDMWYAGKHYDPTTQDDPNWQEGYTILAKKMDIASNLQYGWTTMAFVC
ncbi:hypothetical protein BDZ45DRAFT_753256 [Acephala macrosclerotiorum]|nr:hypothetical protein BDZ45DRAFT_753256 [Acephala macrosclerotiorum]